MPTRRLSVILAFALVAALALSGYLAFVAATSSPVFGCGGGGVWDCGHVMNSRWSKWFGVPVSFLALGTYSLAMVSLVVANLGDSSSWHRYVAWMSVTLLGLAAGLAGVWFSMLQFLALEHLCIYCLATHALGLTFAAIVVWRRPLGFRATASMTVVALIGLSLLIVGQAFGKAPASYRIEHHSAPSEATTDSFDSLFQAPIDRQPSLNSKLNSSHDEQSLPRNASLTPNGESRIELMLLSSITCLYPSLSGAGWVAEVAPETSSLGGRVTEPSNSANRPGLQEKPASPGVPSAEQVQQRLVTLSGGSIKLDVRQWPLVGRPTAKYVLVELFDYTCPHCRNTHRAVEEAAKQFGDDFAIVALPVPLNAKCNNSVTTTAPIHTEACELATLAVAVWLADPAKFGEFHNWMFAGNSTPSYTAARAFAYQLVGEENVRTELSKKVAQDYIARHVELYKRVGAGNVPKLFFPRSTITGEFTSGSALSQRLQTEFNN